MQACYVAGHAPRPKHRVSAKNALPVNIMIGPASAAPAWAGEVAEARDQEQGTVHYRAQQQPKALPMLFPSTTTSYRDTGGARGQPPYG